MSLLCEARDVHSFARPLSQKLHRPFEVGVDSEVNFASNTAILPAMRHLSGDAIQPLRLQLQLALLHLQLLMLEESGDNVSSNARNAGHASC